MIDLTLNHISKRYLIKHELVAEDNRHPLVRKISRLWQRPEEFWALRDISFEVNRGETLGIIGHNGAGKSTILKLLAGITRPSAGRIIINGRLAALIEVGSGFHPELSGRENVYLSGSILGMRRAEIARKLNSIIDFAGLRQFIDTPVKRYSSGMLVRLGFSIAAHLDPEILLLDEVLAVGDAAFQTKCMDRVNELRRTGRTIVFISHDLNAVERICDRVLLLQRGQIIANGSPLEVIEQYKTSVASGAVSAFEGIGPMREWNDLSSAPGNEVVRLRRVRVCAEDGTTRSSIDIRQAVGVEMVYDVLQPGHLLVPNFGFFNQERLPLFYVQGLDAEWRRRPRPIGRYQSTAWIPGNFFADGSYVVEANISTHIPMLGVHAHKRNAVAFNVIDSFEGNSARGDYTGPFAGVVRPLVNWTTQFQGGEDPQSYVLEEAETLQDSHY